MSHKKSKRVFSKTAGARHVHPGNVLPSVLGPMRGGIRR